MNNEISSAEKSIAGLTGVKSAEDIPVALLEAEGECSMLAKELRNVAGARPDLAAVMNILARRADATLQQVAACRRVLMA